MAIFSTISGECLAAGLGAVALCIGAVLWASLKVSTREYESPEKTKGML